MPTKQSPIRTIRRRKEWPAWAKWRTLTDEGWEFLWSARPGKPSGGVFDVPSCSGFDLECSGRRLIGSRKHWRSSLRRIAGKVRG